MSDQTLESGQSGGAAGGQPGGLQQAGDQQASGLSAKEIATALKSPEVAAILDEMLTRKLQSEKDRRISKVEREQGEIKSLLDSFAAYIKAGKTPEEARVQVELDEDLAFIRQLREQTKSPAKGKGGTASDPAVEEALAFWKEAGLDENDPELAKLIQENPEGALLRKAVVERIIKRAAVASNPALAIQSGGGGVGSTPNADKLTTELEGLLKLGVRMTPEQDKRREEVVAELTKLVK